ncbi:MAG: helix-turn-helix transcriptional regulator [Candidatus Competibacteraceae bacterium]
MNNHKGQRLKVARTAAGLSQKQLGERLNIDQAFVSRVEKGTNEGTVTFWCWRQNCWGPTDYPIGGGAGI